MKDYPKSLESAIIMTGSLFLTFGMPATKAYPWLIYFLPISTVLTFHNATVFSIIKKLRDKNPPNLKDRPDCVKECLYLLGMFWIYVIMIFTSSKLWLS